MDYVNIEVSEISTILNTRDEAVKLFNHILEHYSSALSIVLDFTNVEFMSRSFADQFFQLKRSWELQKSNSIKTGNINKQINEILDAVSKSQYSHDNKRPVKSKVMNALHFDKLEEFEEYLLEI